MGAASLWQFLAQPIADTPWSQWRDFWLQRVFDDRQMVVWFLPLLLILLLFSRRNLRHGVILTGLIFVAYVFGAFYMLLWLAMCLVFHRLAEQYAVEIKRTDVLAWAPHAAAVALVVGWYLAIQGIQHIDLPESLNVWLLTHVPWVYPLGSRPFGWEPWWIDVAARPAAGEARPALQLFHWMLLNPHNIGIAYFTIRMLHYFMEIKRGGTSPERRSRLNFVAWLLYAPNFMQGPIERFNEFQDEMDTCHQRRSWANLPPALVRMGWGVFKCLLVIWYMADFLHAIGDDYFQHPERIKNYAALYFGIYAIIFGLYLEFSGYCDISAGMARLLGYRQVENFNWPWLATSLRDFWRRWHISLSFMLRDYVYIALGGNRRRAIRNLCITFILIGVWHIPVLGLTLWGVLMGLMVAINGRWSRWMRRLDESGQGAAAAVRRAWLKLQPLPRICAWALTMHCFCMSLLVFFGRSNSWRTIWELTRRPLIGLSHLAGYDTPHDWLLPPSGE